MFGRYLLLLFLQVVVLTQMQSQTFDILPNMGGIDSQAKAFVIIPGGEEFFVLGDFLDTVQGQFIEGIWPWTARFSHEGELLEVIKLVDSSYNSPFKMDYQQVLHKQGDVYYYYGQRVIDDSYFNTNLIEFNARSGQIIRSRDFGHPNGEGIGWGDACITKHHEKIILVHTITLQEGLVIHLNEVDSNFQITKELVIPNNNRSNYPRYVEVDNEGNYIFVGVSWDDDPQPVPFRDVRPFKIISNSDATDVVYQTLPTVSESFSITHVHTLPIIKLSSGDWIFGVDKRSVEGGCSDCISLSPHLLRISPNFDSIRWQINFLDIIPDRFTRYFVKSVTLSRDSSSIVGSGFRLGAPDVGYNGKAFLFKGNLDGDSVWFRQFIPLNWDAGRPWFATFEDIEITDDDEILVVGSVGDIDLEITRPWILKVDEDGCLVPGCNESVSIPGGPNEENGSVFKIYPNPASSMLYLDYRHEKSMNAIVEIRTMDGSIVRQTKAFFSAPDQYTLPLNGLIPGTYLVHFLDDDAGQLIQTEKLVVFH